MCGLVVVGSIGWGWVPWVMAAPPRVSKPHHVSNRFFLPETTGPLKVGVRQWFFSDASRDEPFTVQTSDVRKWSATVYYPAQVTARTFRTAYMDPLSASVWAKLRHLWQRFELNVFTRAYRDVPVLVGAERFPVVIFSPDLFSLPENYHSLLTDLASHGYVVVGLNHTYASAAVLFPDVGFVSDRIWANGFANSETRGRAMSTYLSTWIADIRYVVEDLIRRDKDPRSFLSGRLNVHKIGVWGHGYGGWAAARALIADDRLVAGVALEGRVEDITQAPMEITKPFLHIVGGKSRELIGTQYHGHDAEMVELLVDGANHVSFEDVALLRPRFDRRSTAPPEIKPGVDPARLIQVVRAYVLAFFDDHLRGREPGLLALSKSPYVEAHLIRGDTASP